MKPISPFRKAIVASFLFCAALIAPASGLISAEAANVIRVRPGKSSGARGKQLATLHSYLLTNPVTVGLAPGENADWKIDAIEQGVAVWSEALPDSPFVMAKRGQQPMITVRFVNSIGSGHDVQGQIEATRQLHWGSSVSYKIEGSMLVRKTTGRRDLDQDELAEVVAHELGHLLGLDDVDECVGLMGPFVPGKVRLKPSKDELNAVLDYRDQLREQIAKLTEK